MRSGAMVIGFLALISLAVVCGDEITARVGYHPGDAIRIQCLGPDQTWGKGPICAETGNEMEVHFGNDGLLRCGWLVSDEMYKQLIKIITSQESWHCRVASSPGFGSDYVPFTIPVWGIVEQTHIHVDNHLNYVFHVDRGFIHGASAYPVRDVFEQTQTGSILHMHGAVRWFKGHTFEPFFGTRETSFWGEFKSSFTQVLIVGLLICLIVFNSFVAFYWFHLRPRIVSKVAGTRLAKKAAAPKPEESKAPLPTPAPLDPTALPPVVAPIVPSSSPPPLLPPPMDRPLTNDKIEEVS